MFRLPLVLFAESGSDVGGGLIIVFQEPCHLGCFSSFLILNDEMLIVHFLNSELF